MTGQRQMLGKVRSGGRLATAPLKINNRYDLKLLVFTPLRHVAPTGSPRLVEISPQIHDLLGRVGSATARGHQWIRPLPFEGQIPKVAALYAKNLCRLADLKRS